MRKEAYERLKGLPYDDSPWTEQEMDLLELVCLMDQVNSLLLLRMLRRTCLPQSHSLSPCRYLQGTWHKPGRNNRPP